MTTQKKTVHDIKPFTTVAAAIKDAEGGFLVMSQGPGTSLLIINNGIPYGFTYPVSNFKQMIFNVFVVMNHKEPDEHMLELRASTTPMAEDKQRMLEEIAGLLPMHTVTFIPACDFDFLLSDDESETVH